MDNRQKKIPSDNLSDQPSPASNGSSNTTSDDASDRHITSKQRIFYPSENWVPTSPAEPIVQSPSRIDGGTPLWDVFDDGSIKLGQPISEETPRTQTGTLMLANQFRPEPRKGGFSAFFGFLRRFFRRRRLVGGLNLERVPEADEGQVGADETAPGVGSNSADESAHERETAQLKLVPQSALIPIPDDEELPEPYENESNEPLAVIPTAP